MRLSRRPAAAESRRVVATVIGGVTLATSIALGGPAAAGTPGVPTSTVKGFGEHTAHYCVRDYAPNRAVTVHNERTGATASIRTDNRGAGCADVPVTVTCRQVQTETIVAAGVAADGNPGTSSARAVVPGNIGPCAGSASGVGTVRSVGGGGLTGTDIAMVAVGAVGALSLAAIGVILIRRRRSAAAG